FLYSSREVLENGDGVGEVIRNLTNKSKIWDVGCNVGIYSLLAAKLGHEVVAFDMSPVAIKLLMKSSILNNFMSIKIVNRALTLERMVYCVPKTAYAGNRVSMYGDQSRL